VTNSKYFGLFMLVAAFAPLYPKMTAASSGYTNFTPDAALMARLTSVTYKACIDGANGNTASINACTDAEYERLDVRLNRSYRATLRRLSPTKSSALRSDERGWVATRSDKCLADLKEEREDGGTIYSILIRDCTLQELKRRILWIESRR
jgi:uncharacterized protein YecT (DUF1311 family)